MALSLSGKKGLETESVRVSVRVGCLTVSAVDQAARARALRGHCAVCLSKTRSSRSACPHPCRCINEFNAGSKPTMD